MTDTEPLPKAAVYVYTPPPGRSITADAAEAMGRNFAELVPGAKLIVLRESGATIAPIDGMLDTYMAEACAILARFGHEGPWLRPWEKGDRAWVALAHDVLAGTPSPTGSDVMYGTYVESYGATPVAAMRAFVAAIEAAVADGTLLTREAVVARRSRP